MKVKQLSLFLENKTGALSRPVKLLAKAKLNILTLSIADTQQFGILRFVVRDWEKAKRVLEKDGFVVKVSDMVAIEVADEPGGLAEILVTLEKARVNLEYMYGFTLKKEGKGVLAFRFDDPDRAIAPCRKRASAPSKAWTCSSGWRINRAIAAAVRARGYSVWYLLRFPIGKALEEGYQFVLVVLHLHGVRAKFDVSGVLPGLRPKRAGLAGLHERNAHIDGHSDGAMRVHAAANAKSARVKMAPPCTVP